MNTARNTTNGSCYNTAAAAKNRDPQGVRSLKRGWVARPGEAAATKRGTY